MSDVAVPPEEPALAGSPGRTPVPAAVPWTGMAGVWLYTVALAAAAIGVFVLFILPLPAFEPANGLAWPIFALTFGLAELTATHFTVRNQVIRVSLSDIPLVIGFYFLAPAALALAQLVGLGAAVIARRREPPQGAVFKLVVGSLGTSLGILVFRLVAPLAPTSLPVWWAASFLGAATFATVTALAYTVLDSITKRSADPVALGRWLALGLALAILNTSVALVAGVFLRTEPDDLWLLAAPVAVGLLGYRAFSAQRLREARLEFLYECTQILQGPLLDETSLARLLMLTREMFRARIAEAILAGPSRGPAVRVIVDEDARPHSETAGSDVMAARRALFANDDAPRLLEHVGPTVGFPDGGTRAAIIVPLRWAGEVQGTLLVAGRRDGLVAFGTDDLRLLETLGSRLGLVAENSGLVERLAASLADASQLAAIVQSSEDAIFAVNADGRITTWNPAAATMFGYRVDEVIGRVAADVLTQGEGDRLRESVGVVFRGAVIRDIQMEWIRADGVLVPVSITMSPIRGPDEQVVSVSAIVRDESDRIKAEAARVASAELLRTVIAGSPVGMGVTGWDHHWIQANPALCALLGMSVEETIGRSALECIHPDDLETVHQLEERVFDGEPTVYSLERRYVDRSGRVVVAIVTARLIREPSSDEPVALYTIADITERRIAEDRTRSTEERFRRAARAISAVQDPTKVLQAVLESARETLRAEYAAVATYSDDGTTITQLQVNGLDSGEMLERLGTWPSATGVRGMAARLDRPIRLRDVTAHGQFAGFPDGHPRISTFLAVPIPHEGAGRAVLFLANKVDAEEFSEADETIAVALATHAAVCLDNARITARSLELVHDLDRANLELVRANEAKTRFLATVAHELRTPLHAILVAGELVHDPPAGPLSGEEIHDLGVTIESSGRHMVRLIDDLVDLSRIESGHLDLRPTHVTLGDVLAEIASTLARTAETRGVTIELPDGPGPSIFADPVRLRQILLNLIANALKFTARGGRVWVAVDTTRESTHITVHDTGIGIAPEDMERAFLPFEQVSRTSTPGAGLGLAISRSLAELHGGELSATSQPGLGSAFTLTLPRRLQPGGRKLPTEPIPLPAPEGGGGLPILVVEDDPTALGLATDLLRMADYQVWQARGLGEAIKVLADATPALILLDIRLGDGSGLDLVERLRTDGKHRDLPILVLSADAMPDDARRARAAGCNDFLAKPVSPRVLLSRIHDLVSEAPEAAEA